MEDQQGSNLHQEESQRKSPIFPLGAFLDGATAFPIVALEMLSGLLDFSPDALLLVDIMGTIVLLNTQLQVLFGYSQGELQGQPVEILVPERLRTLHVRQRLHYLSEPCARPMGIGLDLIGRRKDGGEIPLDVSLRPILVGQTLYIMSAVRDMTAQRLIEQERVQLAEYLRLQDRLINLSPDAILVRDPESHILSWNGGAEDLYGWKGSDALGQRSTDLLATRFPLPLETLFQSLEQEGKWSGDLIHRCRDGREVIVESRWALMRDNAGKPSAILEINRDVTERRRLEYLEQEARAEVKARLDVLQLILDRLSIGIFLVQGPQARLLLANRAATDLWGAEWKQNQSPEEFLAQHQVNFLTEDGWQLFPERSIINRVMTTGEPVLHYQVVMRRSDGVNLPVMLDAIPLDLFQTLPRLPAEMAKLLTSSERVVLVVYQDVTPLKEAEALKDQFISLATHELRTPVTVLAGYADLLLRQATRGKGAELDERQKDKLQAMKEATSQLVKLTEDLLDVTRVQAGQFQLQFRPTDLLALTRQTIEQLQATTERHRLSFFTSFASLRASVDALRIEQVLSNLLSNAIKYSPQGGPVEMRIERNAEKREACFSIRDTGMGIPQEQQAHIFGRFVRADNVRSARIPGTGLGLYLCRELIERHGGSIWFESREHVGSTFFFTLPYETSASIEQTL